MWTHATLRPLRRRRCTAASMAAHVEPQPRMQQLGVVVADDRQRRDVVGDAGDLGGAQVDHRWWFSGV